MITADEARLLIEKWEIIRQEQAIAMVPQLLKEAEDAIRGASVHGKWYVSVRIEDPIAGKKVAEELENLGFTANFVWYPCNQVEISWEKKKFPEIKPSKPSKAERAYHGPLH